MRTRWLVVLAAAALVACDDGPGAPADRPDAGADAGPPGFVVEDRRGRALDAVTLVDWEGYMANPARRLVLRPPPGAAFPLDATLAADHPRVYFDAPSTTGAEGPRKRVTFQSAADAVTVRVAIAPDRDGEDERHALTLSGGGTTTALPLRVLDQDTDRAPVFGLHLDHGHDTLLEREHPGARVVLERAARDWAEYLDDLALDPVDAGAERTFLWNEAGYTDGRWVWNAAPYTGFLLYAYGIRTPLADMMVRSGGAPSDYRFQSSMGERLPLRRSGELSIEVQGNYNRLGWSVEPGGDDTWWRMRNRRGDVPDLYSIAHHEIGHALFFHSAHTNFARFERDGVDDAAVRAYAGATLAIDAAVDHFPRAVDPASLRGAFGNEYHAAVPNGRWLITRLDLLLAQAVGYRLRPTSSLAPLAVLDEPLVDAARGRPYVAAPRATGGTPDYHWAVTEGALPPGLALDSFTGTLSGTPTAAGTFAFTVTVRDELDGPPAARALSLTVR